MKIMAMAIVLSRKIHVSMIQVAILVLNVKTHYFYLYELARF